MTEPYRCSVCESDDPAVRNFVSMPGATGFAQRRCTHESHGTVQHGTVPHDLTGPTPERMSEEWLPKHLAVLFCNECPSTACSGHDDWRSCATLVEIGKLWANGTETLYAERARLRERVEELTAERASWPFAALDAQLALDRDAADVRAVRAEKALELACAALADDGGPWGMDRDEAMPPSWFPTGQRGGFTQGFDPRSAQDWMRAAIIKAEGSET